MPKDKIEVLEKWDLYRYELVCEFDDLRAAELYAAKFGYYVTVNGVFI